MNIEVYTLNAFAKDSSGGNPAGVVIDANGMTDEQMQKIARIVGFSETAFLQDSDQADYKVRYFTPNSEVDLCGHATVAAFYLLGSLQRLDCGTYSIETKAGILEVLLERSGDVYLAQALPRFFEQLDAEFIADSLGITENELAAELPVQIVSTGLRDILIPIRSRGILEQIQPDFQKISEISRKYDVIGYHLFTLDTGDDSIAVCRNFAPLYEIDEESATGTSNGALACYLHRYAQITDLLPDQELIFKQGYSMNLPSEIKAKITFNENSVVSKIQVGGIGAGIAARNIQI